MGRGDVRAKKNLGQHFLIDGEVANSIVDSLEVEGVSSVVEVGPGMGVLTKILVANGVENLYPIEIDLESVDYLNKHLPVLKDNIISGDFLKLDLNQFGSEVAVIGNFPYNISTQIYFKIFDNKDIVRECVGMVQKEVGERICASPGGKVSGILSIFIQAYYDTEYLFTVGEECFNPPPRVKSGVIRLVRNSVEKLGCDEALFFRVVKAGFNQRRKTLRNSLKAIINEMGSTPDADLLSKRPEQLGVKEFISLTNQVAGEASVGQCNDI